MNIKVKQSLLIACSALLLAGAVGITGCSSDKAGEKPTHRTAGTTMDDTSLATRIKTDMYADPLVKGHEVTVEVYRGNVQLSGFVDTAEQKQRAEEIARHFPQVASVQNNLEVKPEPAGSAPAPVTP